MRKSMTSDALPHRGTAAPFRVAIGLALAASAGVMLSVGTTCVSASECAGVMLSVVGTNCVFGPNAAGENRGFTRYPVAYLSEFDAAGETPMTLEDRVAALTAELAQVKAETAKLRESQSDTSEELSHLRVSPANAEIGLAALRTTIEDNEAHWRDTAAQVKAETAKLKDEMLHLRMAQDDTATDIGSLRVGLANSEIGVDSLRATTYEIRQQIERSEAARDATGSIAKSHKHQGHKKWVAQR
jgi:hypothetical protein